MKCNSMYIIVVIEISMLTENYIIWNINGKYKYVNIPHPSKLHQHIIKDTVIAVPFTWDNMPAIKKRLQGMPKDKIHNPKRQSKNQNQS